jgi:hypothetical protein
MQFALEIPELKTVVEFNAIVYVQELDLGCEVSLVNGTSFLWRDMTYKKWCKINADFNAHIAKQQQQQKSNLLLP